MTKQNETATTQDIQKAYACKFCGQCGKLDRIKNFKTEAEATETATLSCDCYEAKFYRTRIENIKKLNEAITEFTEYCENHKIKIDTEIPTLLSNCGEKVIDRKIGKVSLVFANIQITLAIATKSYISISFKFSDGRKIEI